MPINSPGAARYLAAGAFSLLPHESMAQKQAARQQEIGYGFQLLQSMQQQAAQAQQAQAERQQFFDIASTQDVLQPDKIRLKTLTDNYRARMEKIIREQYKGDGRRFEREAQANLLNEFRQDFINSPVLNKALNNKTNYGLYQAAKTKGMMAMPIGYTKDPKGEITGFTPYESQIQDFMAGNTDTITAADMIDYPKDVLEKFAKEYKPGAQFGVYNPQTKQYEAPLVSANELYQAVTNKGYDPQKAFYITKFMLSDQVGQLRWKTEQQAPWDLEKMRHGMSMDLKRLGIAQYNAATSRGHLNIAQQRLNLDKAQTANTYNIFDQATTKPNQGIFTQQDPAALIFPAMPNPRGGNGTHAITTTLPDKNLQPIKDLFGFSDKPSKTTLRTPGIFSTNDFTIPTIGAVTEIVSPNSGQAFRGNYAVTSLGNQYIYRNETDPTTGKETRQAYITARVAIDDDTAFKQNIKQNFGLWDQSTPAFQGRNQELKGGGFFGTNDLGEYEVYIPIPNTPLLKFQQDHATAPKGSAPYFQNHLNSGQPQSQSFNNLNSILPK